MTRSREVDKPPPVESQSGQHEKTESAAAGTHLLVGDVELVPFQHHVAVLPDLPENPFPAEFPDPADLLGRCRLVVSILRPLPPGKRTRGR